MDTKDIYSTSGQKGSLDLSSLVMDEQHDSGVGENPGGLEENEDEKDPSSDNFKKPLLMVGPQRGKFKGPKSIHPVVSKETKPLDNTDNHKEKQDKSKPKEEIPASVSSNNPTLKVKEPPPLPYTEPDWSGVPEEEYKLEVSRQLAYAEF